MGNGWHDEGTTWYGTMIDANTTGVKCHRILKKSYVGGGFSITLI